MTMKERLQVHRQIMNGERLRLDLWKVNRLLSLSEIRRKIAEHDRNYIWDDEYIVLRRLQDSMEGGAGA